MQKPIMSTCRLENGVTYTIKWPENGQISGEGSLVIKKKNCETVEIPLHIDPYPTMKREVTK